MGILNGQLSKAHELLALALGALLFQVGFDDCCCHGIWMLDFYRDFDLCD